MMFDGITDTAMLLVRCGKKDTAARKQSPRLK